MITDEQYARDRLTILADKAGLRDADLAGPDRSARVAAARKSYMQTMRLRGVSSTVIGRVLKRDPSTIRALWK